MAIGNNLHMQPHNPDFFRGLGFNRRQRVGMFFADLTAIATQNNPSQGGVWPSDVTITSRLSQLDSHPSSNEAVASNDVNNDGGTPIATGGFDTGTMLQ